MATTDIYQIVTDRIVKQLQAGVIPWQQPWTGGGTQVQAISYTTGAPYSLINQFLLGKPGEYLTFNQAKKLGGHVKKGAESGIIVFYKMYEKNVKNAAGEDDVIKFPVLKYYHVFHLDDIEGIESKLETSDEETTQTTLKPIEAAEGIISDYLRREKSLKYESKLSAQAFYSPTFDSVTVPHISQYKEISEYYSTNFHELVHSTMHPDRCNRPATPGAHFGSKDYSKEELVAEIGAAMLCNVCKLDTDKSFNNSVSYISDWLKALKNDNKMIVWAAGKAEKAAQYIKG